MIQDLLGHLYAPLGRTESVFSNIVATLLCVAAWGYFVYQGTIDPLGGVNTIWPLFGISNSLQGGPFSSGSSANRRIDLQATFSF